MPGIPFSLMPVMWMLAWGKALFSLLFFQRSILRLSSTHLFECRAQALNLDTSTLSYIDDSLLVSQGRTYNKTLLELTSSYSIISDLMASFGLLRVGVIMRSRKVKNF